MAGSEKTLQEEDLGRDSNTMTGQTGPDVPRANAELTILQALRRIIRAVDIHSRALASRYGVTGPQLVCLTTLCDSGAMTSAELSRRIFVSASTITGIIDRLEKNGLVERKRDEIDRRRVLLHPTGEGFKLAYRAPSLLQDELMRKVRELPQEQQDRISQSLQQIVDLMEARSLDASPILTTGDIQAGASARMKSPALGGGVPVTDPIN